MDCSDDERELPTRRPVSTKRKRDDDTERDPVAEAQDYSRRATEAGLRRYVCHVCEKEFPSGSSMNSHFQTSMDEKHVEHRMRMLANSDVSKEASIVHRAKMKRKGVERKTGIGARVVFKSTGDVVLCVGKLGASDNAWKLEGGRICKFKTEGQRWRWECDT